MSNEKKEKETTIDKGEEISDKLNNKKWLFLGAGLLLITILSCLLINYSFKDMSNLKDATTTSATKYYTHSKEAYNSGTSTTNLYKLYDFSSYSKDKNFVAKVKCEKKNGKITCETKNAGGKKGWIFKGSTKNYKYDSEWDKMDYVYCIEFGNEFQQKNDSAKNEGNSEFYKNLSDKAQEAINLLTIYGFPNKLRNSSVTLNKNSKYIGDVQYMATQTLIWEFQQGWRTEYNSKQKPTGTGLTIYNKTIAKNKDLETVYKAILDDMANSDKMPSFTGSKSSSATSLTYTSYGKTGGKWTYTFTDTNGILSKVSATGPNNLVCDKEAKEVGGISCKKSGNKLVITSTKALTKDLQIKFTKTIGNKDITIVDVEYNTGQRMGVAVPWKKTYTKYLNVKTEPLGSITVEKDSEDNVKEGFKFEVSGDFNGDGKTTTEVLTTNSKGIDSIKNIKLGTYTIKEINVPAKYESNDPEKVKLTKANPDKTLEVYNTLVNNSKVKIKKIDAKTKKGLKGAVLELKKGNTQIDKWTTTKGWHTPKEELEIGVTYTVCEIEAPPGYILNKKCQDIVLKDKNDVKIVEFEDQQTELTVEKIDKETKNKISSENIKLKLIDNETKKEIDSWTTDEENPRVIDKLVIGRSYTIKEESTIKGYIPAADKTFTFDGNENIKIENAPIKITVYKKDNAGNLIKGARLKLVEDGNETEVIDEWVSEEGKAHDVPVDKIKKYVEYGKKYKVIEAEAPDGYVPAGDTSIAITKANNTATLVNTTTTVKISKVDAVSSEEIPGAHIIIRNNNSEVVHEWTSKANNVETIEGCKTSTGKCLNYGETYTLTEIIAPDGYALANEQEFTIGKDPKVVMKNELTKVEIYKKDKNSNDLVKGAKLQLLEKTEKGEKKLYEWTSSDKAYVVNGLKTGVEYIIREVEAPEGYTKTEDKMFSLLSNQASYTVEVLNTPKVDVPNTDASASTITIIIGSILMVGGIGAAVLIRKGVKKD